MGQNDLLSCHATAASCLEIPQPASASMLRWFLIFSKPAGEATAKTNLERQGYRVYYPRLLQRALLRGRWIDRIVALFPRYLFVQLDVSNQSLAPVRSTLGVANIVQFGAQSAIVPDGIVTALVERADPESGLHRLGRTKAFAPGSLVSVVGGAFDGLNGIFEREAGSARVVVLLELLGHSTSVSIPAQNIAAVATSSC